MAWRAARGCPPYEPPGRSPVCDGGGAVRHLGAAGRRSSPATSARSLSPVSCTSVPRSPSSRCSDEHARREPPCAGPRPALHRRRVRRRHRSAAPGARTRSRLGRYGVAAVEPGARVHHDPRRRRVPRARRPPGRPGRCWSWSPSVLLGWSGSAELRWGALLHRRCLPVLGDRQQRHRRPRRLRPAHITLVKGVVAGGANLADRAHRRRVPRRRRLRSGRSSSAPSAMACRSPCGSAGARDLGAARGQLVFATAPFVGAVVAWTVLGEDATARQVLSLVIAAVGVSFVLGSDHLHRHRHDPGRARSRARPRRRTPRPRPRRRLRRAPPARARPPRARAPTPARARHPSPPRPWRRVAGATG